MLLVAQALFDYTFSVGSFFLGAILASFAGVCVERVGTGQSWKRGRSKCNSCNSTLRTRDLVPVFSWLYHFGRCSVCTSKVPGIYPISEAVLGSLFLLSYLRYGLSPLLLLIYVFLFLLAILVLYDIRHTIVPFAISLSLVLLGAVVAVLEQSDTAHLATVFISAGSIALGFLLLHVLSKGKWMGLGDTPIALALSLAVGTQALPGLLFSFWSGAVIGIVILATTPKGRRIGIEVPFVPFLAFGYLLALFTQWNPLSFVL